MSITKQEFEIIKTKLATVISGGQLPSFKDAEALQLIKSCTALATSGEDALLASLGVSALFMLVKHQELSVISEHNTKFILKEIRSK